MNRHADGIVDSRGTVLVASGSSLFLQIVGGMLADCGLTAAFPAESEAAWLSITRTQPVLVICDSRVPATRIKRLIVEAFSRRLPLLMAWSKEEHDTYAPDIALPDRVAWLTFPVDDAAFRSTIDGLLPTPVGQTRRLKVEAAGFKAEAAVRVRTIEETLPKETLPKETRRPEASQLPDRGARGSLKLMP